MTDIAKVQLTDTINYQRLRVNDIIDNLNNSTGSSIIVVNTEADLPAVAAATSNTYLIKAHTTYKSAVLACIVNSTYRMTPLKYDVNNANTYIYADANTIGSDVALNRCVYINSSGIWNLADSTDNTKQAVGIYGANNCIIFTGVYKSASLSLTTGSTYYYDSTGALTLTETSALAGVALSTNTIRLMLGINNPVQSDWSQTDTNATDYIKNKPSVVTKQAIGFAPQLPNESTVTKFLRQDGTWSIPSNTSTASAGYCPTLPSGSDASKKYLTGTGTWQQPIVVLTSEAPTGIDGVLYAVIEEY